MQDNSKKLLDFIKSRQSIRTYQKNPLDKEIIKEILECGKYAPSGLNNQPWKVFVLEGIKDGLALFTHYENIIRDSAVCLAVFLDIEKGYNRVKDIQSLGAFMQNLLLGAHALDLGAVWLGEILNKKEGVNELLNLDTEKFELMGVIAIGERAEDLKELEGRERRTIEDFVEWL